jgi:hypothetical protein
LFCKSTEDKTFTAAGAAERAIMGKRRCPSEIRNPEKRRQTTPIRNEDNN